MRGTGYPAGCEDIDSCEDNPCDDVALRCLDFEPPLNGFKCMCPGGTVGVGPGNIKCIG